MNFIINKILQCMQDEKLILSQDVATYHYGIHIMFLKIIHYSSIFILGILLGRTLQILVFTICYSIVRSYAGGYHAKHSAMCFLISILMVLGIHLTIDWIPATIGLSISILSTIIIVLFSPVITVEKPLGKEDIVKNKRISICLSLILLVVFIILLIADSRDISLSVGYSLFFCSFYIALAIVINKGEKYE